MNVAIIGAGLAGLSCAHELERYSIRPVIYEKNGYIGDQFSHVSAILEITSRPISDPIKYFKKLGLNITPLNTVNTVIHHAPHKTTVIKGNLGYFFKRSQEKDELKNQIYSQLKNTNILFNEYGDYSKLMHEYDYVVIANGDSNYTKELGCWQEKVKTYARGAVVMGSFDPNTLVVWLNKEYCKNGYAYLTPFDSNRASLALITTDVDEKEIDAYWDKFLYTENIRHTIVQEFKLEHKAAYVYPLKVNNIYLAGDAAGVIDPFLGFGQMSSITMGVMAARSIAEGYDYYKLIKKMRKINTKLYEFRKALNASNNFGYDLMMTAIGLPGIKHLIYYTPFNLVKTGGFIIKKLPIRKKIK